jgi:hypothetical protein
LVLSHKALNQSWENVEGDVQIHKNKSQPIAFGSTGEVYPGVTMQRINRHSSSIFSHMILYVIIDFAEISFVI